MSWKKIGVIGEWLAVRRICRIIPREARMRGRRGEPVIFSEECNVDHEDPQIAMPAVQSLVSRGAEIIAVADHFESWACEAIEREYGAPVYDCVRATHAALAATPLPRRRVGLFFSEGPSAALRYERALRMLDIVTVQANGLTCATGIYQLREACTVPRVDQAEAFRKAFETVLRPFLMESVDAVILGSPLFPRLEDPNLDFMVLNPFDLLAAHIIQKARSDSSTGHSMAVEEQVS